MGAFIYTEKEQLSFVEVVSVEHGASNGEKRLQEEISDNARVDHPVAEIASRQRSFDLLHAILQ